MNTLDSSLRLTLGGHRLPIFTRLVSQGHPAPNGSRLPIQWNFYAVLISVSNTTYIQTISHGHTRRITRLLPHTHTITFTVSSHKPQSNRPTSTSHLFLQANKKKVFSHPSSAVTRPTLYSTSGRPPPPAATIHARLVICHMYPPIRPHPHLTTSSHLHSLPMVFTFCNFTFYILSFSMILYLCFIFHLS